jgi:hypothetical protein
VSKQK